jgi:hypothetical protein
VIRRRRALSRAEVDYNTYKPPIGAMAPARMKDPRQRADRGGEQMAVHPDTIDKTLKCWCPMGIESISEIAARLDEIGAPRWGQPLPMRLIKRV